MDGALKSVIAFLDDAGADMAELATIANHQIGNLRITFAGQGATPSVAANAMAILAEQQVFSDAQKSTLRTLIQIATSTAGNVHATRDTKRQTMREPWNYGTDRLWAGIRDKGTTDDCACNLWVDVLHMVGCRYMDPDTSKAIVATTLS